MSRSTVNRILIAYLIIIWGAVLVRCDQFPMTWAPMYSVYTPSPKISATVRDHEALERGLLVTHRDGSTSYLTRDDLNIPKRSFWPRSRIRPDVITTVGLPVAIRAGAINKNIV